MAAKILLVEDDNNLREIYEARLQAEGYTIVSAPDGEAALVVAKAEKPDLIISDVMMPRISGFEMLDILRNTEELKDIKVIMLTALGQAEDKTRANSLGADRYLVKSQVTLEDIVKAAHLLIDGTDGTVTPPVSTPANPSTVTPIPPQPAAMPAPPPTPAPVPTPPAAVPSVVSAPPIPLPSAPPVQAEPETTTSTPLASPAPANVPAVSPTEPTISGPEATQPAPTVVAQAANEPTSAAPITNISTLSTPTTQEENAEVKTQIDNFANNLASPAAPSPSVTGDGSATNEALVKDDSVLSEAVNDLTTNTPAPDNSATLDEATKPHDQMTNPSSLFTPSQPAPAVANDTTSSSLGSGNVVIANKKIIEPIKSEPKPGLDELLAAEVAKSNANPLTISTDADDSNSSPSNDVSPQPGSTFGPSPAPPAPNQSDTSHFDPNDIAL